MAEHHVEHLVLICLTVTCRVETYASDKPQGACPACYGRGMLVA